MAADNQADVDRIIIATPDELLGPVERVDQEISVAVLRDAAGRDLLLGNHRNAGRGGLQRAEDDRLRRPIAHGDGGFIALGLDLEAGLHQSQDLRPRRTGGDHQNFEELLFVVDQRGAIRMPPSRRMLSALR